MSENKDSLILSDWYEIIEDEELKQGNILENCPVFYPPKEMKWPVDLESEPPEFGYGLQKVIIMSQSCDLEPNQKSDMWLVLLCPIWSLLESSKVNQFLASSFGKEECRRGHMTGYHMIDQCDHKLLNQEISIVSFREVWSLPLDFVRNLAKITGARPCLRSPYREHLAQSFARYFMRVGLPVNIPEFKSDKAERVVMNKLNAMDEETRKRIFSYFS